MKAGSFYVTTPIYYVNDKPHIGHAYTTILADVLARYHRLAGDTTHFLTGTDEHGQKVLRAAQKSGISPQEQADSTVVRFRDLWKKLEITNDDFIRTTEERHKAVVQRILSDLFNRGEIYRADYDGWYCVTCERFYTDRDVTDGLCPEPGCGRQVERIHEANYFFRMSRHQQWLIDYINSNPGFIQPDFRRNETLGFLRKPLNDLCISRPKSRMNWGIELPFDKDFVTYVWFDALVNYISAVGYLSDDAGFNARWPADVHLIGKDILTTHTVYWPTMLHAMGVQMPKTVFAHGWWLVGRDKMSKTQGNVVDPMAFADKYGVDAFRYFLMAEMTLGQDASFTEEAFIRRYNADLANDLGNMLSRVSKLLCSHCGGSIPEPGETGAEETELRDAALAAARATIESVKTMRIDQGLAGIADVVRRANRYIERQQPWNLARDGRAGELRRVLYCAAETLRIVSGMLYPVMPGKMADLREALGMSRKQPDFDGLIKWGGLKPGLPVAEPSSLFPRVQPQKQDERPPKEAKPVAAKPSGDAAAGPTPAGLITVDDFFKAKLRAARILSAEAVEGASKLLKLRIDAGDGERQIVAGIALHYKPEELVGRTIVVVSNLQPARIRGVESNGMLLAASAGGVMRLVTVDGDIPAGAPVK